jgi:hypothetical protein
MQQFDACASLSSCAPFQSRLASISLQKSLNGARPPVGGVFSPLTGPGLHSRPPCFATSSFSLWDFPFFQIPRLTLLSVTPQQDGETGAMCIPSYHHTVVPEVSPVATHST